MVGVSKITRVTETNYSPITSGATSGVASYSQHAVKDISKYYVTESTYTGAISWTDDATTTTDISCDDLNKIIYKTYNKNFTISADTSLYVTSGATSISFGFSRREELLFNIRRNLEVAYRASNSSLMSVNHDPAELRARRLLADMLSEEEFRRYLIRGFIIVRGKSGIIYKISTEIITSYVKNTKTGKYAPFETFCIVFKDSSLPPTDAVIMRKILIETDEFGMRKKANVSKVTESIRLTQPNNNIYVRAG